MDIGKYLQEDDFVVEVENPDGSRQLMGRHLPLRRTSRERRFNALRIAHFWCLRRAFATVEDIIVHLYGLVACAFGLFAHSRHAGAALNKKIILLLEGMAWLHCCGHMLSLTILGHLYFDHAEHRFLQERSRAIDELSEHDSYSLTGCAKRDLRQLHRHLRAPEQFMEEGRHFQGEASFIIFLSATRAGENYLELSRQVFGGDPCHFTCMCRAALNHLCSTFYHKISGNSMAAWCSEENVTRFRHAIWNRLMSGALQEAITRDDGAREQQIIQAQAPFEPFRPFAFIGCMAQPTARPGDEPMRATRDDENQIRDPQRSFCR